MWIDRGRERGLRDGELVVTDFVDDDVLRALYQQARLFVLPSFYEGFGLPVLEAAQCGCPAVASNASAVPEVLQWSPASFSPSDLDEMASVVERGLADEEFRLELRRVGEATAARHTWERVADRTITACARLDAAGTRRGVPKPRVGLVGSFSPDGERARPGAHGSCTCSGRQWRSTASTHPVRETATRCGGATRSACSGDRRPVEL